MLKKLRYGSLALLLVLAACGGDGTSTESDAGSDAAVQPDMSGGNADSGPTPDAGADAADTNTCDDDAPSVSIDPPSPVSVAFDAESTTIRLDFDEPVSGVEPMAFDVDNGATIESVGGMDDIYDVTVAGLQPSTTYTVTLPAQNVTDNCENELDEDLIISIEVGADPCDSDSTPPTLTVSPTPPIELMTGTTTTAVTLQFSEPIESVMPTANNGATIADVSNPDGNDWVVTLENLADGTTTVSIPTSTLDLCGNALAAAVDFDIIVGSSDGTAPMVISSTPNNGATGVALDTNIVFEFSEPMDTSAGSIDLTANGTNAAFTSMWSSGDRVLTIDPTTDFGNGDGVVAVLNNFADPAGNALPNEVLAFTTVPDPCVFDTTAPQVSSVPASPVNLTPGATGTTIVLSFNEQVNGVAGALSIDRGATIQSVSASGNNYSVSLANLAVGTNTLTLGTSVTDSCGNALSSPRTFIINAPSNDQTPPTLISTTPSDGATNVARDSDIIINWSEAMSQTGFATIRVNGVTLQRTLTWDNASTLRVDPTGDFQFGALVEVRLSSFQDVAGNAAAFEVFTFRVEPDPCEPYPANVSVVSTAQDGILADASGEVWVLVELSDLFPLQESQLSVTPQTGGGTLVAGSLTGTGNAYAFRLTGTAPNDVYDVTIASGTQNNGCTTLGADTITVTVPDTITVNVGTNACPFPAAAAQDFTGGDACNVGPTNDSNSTATQTGLTLDAIGDVISISGTYDSDHSSDFDYFAFDVVEDGTTSKDLQISVFHGCNYTGTPSDDDFEVALEEAGGFGTIGPIFYGAPTVRDAFNQNVAAVARAVRTVDGPAGTNSYVLELNEQGGGSWCMDFRAFVEVIDTGRPASCDNTPVSVQIENTPQTAYANEFTGDAEISIVLSGEFGSLSPSDIEVIPLGGARGSLKPGTLSGSGSVYTAQLGGVQPGETYLVTLATGSTSCTTVQGSGFYVTITDNPLDAGNSGACPLPSPAQDNYTGIDACNAETNGTLATSEATSLALQNVGDRISIGGTIDTDDGDDYYSFTINENGTNIYTFDVALIYGCAFSDSSGTNAALDFDVLDAAGVVVGSATGTTAASTFGDSWQSVSGTVQVASGAGANTYHLVVKDGGGSGLCFDYIAYMELTDVSGDGACLGRTSSSSLDATSVSTPENGGNASVTVSLSSGYTLTAADLTLTPITGTGTLDAASFNQLNSSTYEVDLTGVATGDQYTLSVAGGTDSCGTTLTGGDITVNVENLPDSTGSCPLPSPLPNNFDLGETCSSTPTNGTQSTAADTGFVLSQPGDSFSITNVYNTSGSDYDWFAFEIDNPGIGTSFTLDVRFVYGCGLYGASSPSGSSSMDVQVRNSSGSATTDISGLTSYNAIASGSFYDYGEGTRTVTPTASGLNTFYIWQDDPSGSGFCFDMVTYVTLVSVN